MAQNNNDLVKRTKLEYNTVIADFGPWNGRAKIVEANINYSVISLDEKLFMVFATPEFDKSKWWLANPDKIVLIQRLVIQPSFQYEKLQGKFCELPTWVTRLKGLTYLKLNQVFIDRLDLLQDTEIKFLEFNNVKIGNGLMETLINDLKRMRHLRGIGYDGSIPSEIVQLLKINCINCELYSFADEKQKEKFMQDSIQ